MTGERIKILGFRIGNEKGGRFRVPLFELYMAAGTTTFFAVLRFAALRTVFFAAFFAGFLAVFFVVLRAAALRTDFFATFFAGFLAAAFFTFLAIFISSSLLVRWYAVGRELFDSPKIFLQQFGLQVVSASPRANFSTHAFFLFAMTVRKLCEP
ncbi:MAG: hypothetical protein JNL81_12725 [Hyphomonadaceae bacterium]|nr:hypothetical protein [Hyphomonadaceae bacterium]